MAAFARARRPGSGCGWRAGEPEWGMPRGRSSGGKLAHGRGCSP